MAINPAFDGRAALFGIPVHFRWNCLLYGLVLAGLPGLLDRPWWTVWTAAWVGLGSVLLLLAHELGHAWAARLSGCAVHGVLISGAGGKCYAALPATPGGQLWFFSGGIAMQAVIGAAALAVLTVRARATGFDEASRFVFLYVNGLYMALNALPIKQQDGMHIVKALIAMGRRPER